MIRMTNNKSILDIILRSILKNEDIASRVRDISVAEMLERLKSAGVDETTKMFLVLGLLGILGQTSLLDLTSLFDIASSKLTKCGNKDDLHRDRDSFAKKYKIQERDKLLVAKIIEGVPLKQFKDEINISSSNANKRIRALWQKLGLENREQLIYVFGRKRLIDMDLECLHIE